MQFARSNRRNNYAIARRCAFFSHTSHASGITRLDRYRGIRSQLILNVSQQANSHLHCEISIAMKKFYSKITHHPIITLVGPSSLINKLLGNIRCNFRPLILFALRMIVLHVPIFVEVVVTSCSYVVNRPCQLTGCASQ